MIAPQAKTQAMMNRTGFGLLRIVYAGKEASIAINGGLMLPSLLARLAH